MIIYLSLGSNLGNRSETIENALALIRKHSQIEITAVSSFLETKPYGFLSQPDFINCSVRIDTELSAQDLLLYCQQIENSLGRIRDLKWGPRTIDIDILFYGDEIVETEDLLIPHPGIRHRRYLLESLMELCPDYIHPLLKRSVCDLLKILDNRQD